MSRCEVCFNDHATEFYLCDDDRKKLIALLGSVRIIDPPFIQLNDIKLGTSITGTQYVVAIDGKGVHGWQRPFGIDGSVKCMVCDGLSQSLPVCDDCRAAILAFRMIHTDREKNNAVESLINAFTNTKLKAFFELAGEAAFEKWMAKELEEMSGDEDPD